MSTEIVITSVSQLEKAFGEWVLGASGNIFTMWSGQKVTVPEEYILFEHISKRAITKPIETQVKKITEDKIYTYYDIPSEAVIRLTVFGDNSYERAWKLESSLGKISWRNFFNDKGIGIQSVTESEPIVEPEDFQYLKQAQFRIAFNFTWRDLDCEDLGQISFVSGQATIDPKNPTHDFDFEIDGQYLWT